jgi:CheY-like chemotaxis protein
MAPAYSEGEGRGSSFVLTLPLTPALESPIQGSTLDVKASVEDLEELDGLRVLIVDDEEAARERVSTVLAAHGVVPVVAHNVADAIDALVQYRPDVVISDIGMPGEDGYSFIRRVRLLPPESGAGTPAAALTAFASADDRTQALIAGYQMHIPKPVAPPSSWPSWPTSRTLPAR